MKAEEIECTNYALGKFIVQVRRCVFDTRPLEDALFFEVMLFEKTDCLYYVDPREDPRFLWWANVGKFDRRLVEYEIVEYNSIVDRRHLLQTTWKLHRFSVARLYTFVETMTASERKAKNKKHA